MTRVIPPREAFDHNEAIRAGQPRGSMRWSTVRSTVLRIASILLLFRGAMYWLDIFGAQGSDFAARPLHQQVTIAVLALLSVTAGVGVWALSVWGVALWLVCLGIESAVPITQISVKQLLFLLRTEPFVATSMGLFVLFIVTALLSLRD